MTPAQQFIVITLLIAVCTINVGLLLYNHYCFPKKRKDFVIEGMKHCLNTREEIYGTELINYCRTILHNIETHSDMKEHFKLNYTYGKYEIGVNWYPVNGLFEFIIPSKFEAIARIYYPL